MLIDDAALAAAVWRQCWQVTLLIAVMALVTKWLFRKRPQLAHLLWMIVIVKCLTPPLWSSPTSVFSWAARRDAPVTNEPSAVAWIAPRDNGAGANRQDRRAHQLTMQPKDGNATVAFATTAAPLQLNWLKWLAVTWMIGASLLAAFAVVKWLVCWRILNRCAAPAPPELVALAARLSERLGLRRQVRIVIAARPWGPAVIGLWRPTIVLPAAILKSCAKINYELLLAHELVHVRRNDSLCAVLQLAAQLVWWFHPLVWWMNRRIRIERERCCDEEVVAGLRCRPADYADSLLALLQWKVSLRSIPGFPAARAADVTSDRLEEIVMGAKSFQIRAPRWCWMLAFLVALTVLPGAALTFGESAETSADSSPASSADPTESTDTRQPKAAPTSRQTPGDVANSLPSLALSDGDPDSLDPDRLAKLAMRRLDVEIMNLQTQYNRVVASREELSTLTAKFEGSPNLSASRLLEAQRRAAQNETEYARRVLAVARIADEPAPPLIVFEYQIAMDGVNRSRAVLKTLSQRMEKNRGHEDVHDLLYEQLGDAKKQYEFFTAAAKNSLRKLHEMESAAHEAESN